MVALPPHCGLIQPTVLEGTPDVVYEDANNPGFNRIRFQAGNGPSFMDFDEVRVGRTWNDVVPMTVVATTVQKTSMETALSASATSLRLSAWGSSGGAADVDGDGTVAFGDVLAVLSAFGPC